MVILPRIGKPLARFCLLEPPCRARTGAVDRSGGHLTVSSRRSYVPKTQSVQRALGYLPACR